jgi:hypothetical protein
MINPLNPELSSINHTNQIVNEAPLINKGEHAQHYTYEMGKLLICLTCKQLTGGGDWNKLHDPNNRTQKSAMRRAYVQSGKQAQDEQAKLAIQSDELWYGNPI